MAYLTNKIKNIEGTEISIDDSYKLKDLSLEGDTYQEGTPTPDYPQEVQVVTGRQEVNVVGKNLAPSDWASKFVSAVNNTNQAKLETKDNRNCLYYYANAGYRDYPNKNFTLGTTFKENTQYTLSYDILKTDTTSKTISIRYTDGTWSIPSDVQILDTWGHQTITSSANKTIDYICPYYTSGTTYIDLDTWQIEEGTVETEYEPYKNKSFEIKLASDNLFETFTNGSITNQQEATTGIATIKQTFNYTRTLTFGNGEITGYPAIGNGSYYIWKITFNLKPNTRYTLSCDVEMNNMTGASASGNVWVFNNNFNVNNKTTLSEHISAWGFTTGADGTYTPSQFINVDPRAYQETTTMRIYNIMLVEGQYTSSTMPTYEKYFNPIWLGGINDYKDLIYKNTKDSEYYDSTLELNEWYLKKALGRIILDGSENWLERTNASNIKQFYCGNGIQEEVNIEPTQICNYFDTYRAGLWNYGRVGQFAIFNYPKYFIAGVSDDLTLNDFKTKLASNNLIAYYVPTNPTYEKITNENLISQLESIRLLEGVNNISVSSDNLSAILNLDYYSTENPYQDAIYSQDDKNDLKIWFDDVELEDASRYCESITRTARILPDDGGKRFSLDNFISTSLEIILHDIDPSIIKDQVKISIGTDVGDNEFEYIPLGIFNIQDVPETDGRKVTLKLRDNRVKFDFDYDAYPLIQSLGGKATKRQILEDICEKAGVENEIKYFDNEDDFIGIYDNSIEAQTYVSYLMEQAGLIATIDRYGKLIAIDLSELDKWKLPLSIVEGWDKGDPYKVERVVYEGGVIKYQTSEDEDLDTLYINSANPYIESDTQVEGILNKLEDFEIDSITTKKVLGNPAIDPYDIIEVYNDLDGTNDIVFKTLGNTSYTFNGVHRDKFDTQIGKEERTENVSKNSQQSFQKLARASIDNINANISLLASTTEQYRQDNEEMINELIQRTNSVQQQITSTQATIEVMQQEIVDGQQTLKNNLVTIDINGINVSTNTSAIATLMTNEKFVIKSGDTYLAYFGYDEETGQTKAEMDNLTVTNYFTAGYHRVEKITIDGEHRTGWFYVDED